MKPVFQTIIDEKRGNCLSAALASILEIDLAAVPNFMEIAGTDGDFHSLVDEWLASKGWAWFRTIELRQDRGEGKLAVGRLPEHGAEMIRHRVAEGVFCLATGKSPRGEWCHSVVGRMVGGFNFELLHDPHPSGAGLDGLPVCIEFLVPLDPARMMLCKTQL